ncbi:MAG TPA: CCA tRNA nucleotidyltransferase [Gemmatimonadaceae bacterium]
MTDIARRIQPPSEVIEIAAKLEKAGYETWCVGGGVRDALIGIPNLDWDLATAAPPQTIRSLFRRTIPVGEKFGTIIVLDRHNVKHEVTTFRRDVETDGRHAVVEFGVSLDEDLSRRDFTINAIAYSPSRGVLHDPFDGIRDLEARVVRAVGEPGERMKEDRLRALRAIRFAARYDFSIEPRTWEAVAASAPYLERLSAERVKQEIEKTMEQVPCPGRAFAMWRESGALGELVPSLAHISATDLATLDAMVIPRQAGHSRRRMMRLIALFAAADADRVAPSLRGLRFANTDIRWISETVQRWHLLEARMTAALLRPEGPADAELREWAALAGRTRLAYVLRLAAARWHAIREGGIGSAPPRERVASAYRRAIRIAYRDPIEVGDLALNGSDLERLGLSGPAVGQALQRLLRAVVEDPSVNTPARLEAIIRGEMSGGDGTEPSSAGGRQSAASDH